MTVMTRSAPCRFLVLLLFSLSSLCDVNEAYPKSDLQLEDRDGLEQELEELSWPLVQSTNENDLVPRREEALQKIQEVTMTIPCRDISIFNASVSSRT
jgi:hypothetical protein